MPQGIYLDNSTVTRPSDRAIAAMLPFMTQRWGIPAMPHGVGQEASQSLSDVWKALYQNMEADEEDTLVVTGSGAEAVNEAILTAHEQVSNQTGKNQFITATTDEAPAILSLGRLEQMGCVARTAACTQGLVTAQAVGEAMTPRTALVSLSWANGLTGVINPVAEIGALCRDRGVLLHLDASHVMGKLFFELEDTGAHFLTFGGGAIHGPRESGLLWVKKGMRPTSLVLGGPVRTAGAAGISQALAEAVQQRDYVCTEIARLRNKLETGILENIPDSQVFFREHERVPTISCIGFPGVVNEALLYTLNRRNLYASIGGGTFQQIALVLEACGIKEIPSQTALSFGLSRETTEEEVDRAVDIISDTVKKIRKTSMAPT